MLRPGSLEKLNVLFKSSIGLDYDMILTSRLNQANTHDPPRKMSGFNPESGNEDIAQACGSETPNHPKH